MFFRRKKQSPPDFEQQLEAARKQGFTVEVQPGGGRRARLSKLGCAAVVEPVGDGRVRFVEKPGVVIGGEIARLLDRGYQKFFATRASEANPALAGQLRAVHQFTEELRLLFRVHTLYNESLGTVSDRYHYDRVEGREPKRKSGTSH